MFNKLKNKWMAFKNLFNDKNDINEKSVVGFAAFAIMTLFAVADLVTGYFGKDFANGLSVLSVRQSHHQENARFDAT